MKLTNLFESLDDTKNLEIQNKTRNFYFSTRTGLKCHANFNWPNPISLGLINVGAVIELTDGVIPSNLFSQFMISSVDYIKTLELEPSDIDKLEIRISSLFVTYMGVEIKMNDLLLQTEKIHYSKRFKLSNLMDSETEDVYGTEILRNFPRFSDDLESRIQNIKNNAKNFYRTIKKGKVGEFIYELPDNPKIEVKLSMDDVRKESTIISPKLNPYLYVEKNEVDIKNKPEDIDDATLNVNFYHQLGLIFGKFKIKLIISE